MKMDATHGNLGRDIVKPVLRGEFIVCKCTDADACLSKKGRSQINNLPWHVKELEKEEAKLKADRRQEKN